MNQPDEKPIRLQAYLAASGLGSRRHCESFILAGRVHLNGVQASLGQSVRRGDSVLFDGAPVSPQERLRYLMLNKPAGYVSAMSDPQGRALAIDLFKDEIEERIYNIGRLDQWSCGLLLFTNDGIFARRLSHPSGNIEKEYELVADAVIPKELVSEFPTGVLVEGVLYTARSVRILDERKARIVLVEGRNREIRRVLAHYGLRALNLKRVRIGPLQLGGLKEGCYRELTPGEVKALDLALSN
ncbi:MAG: rRNA pseudouridine synthase [Spirochaetaceae bacterium]|nr:rRNA pseudouridine synthase [Spirochaetaceae bacterium]